MAGQSNDRYTQRPQNSPTWNTRITTSAKSRNQSGAPTNNRRSAASNGGIFHEESE